MSAWEYRKTGEIDERVLNLIGKEGWELVAVAGVGSVVNPARLYFKRLRTVAEKETDEP